MNLRYENKSYASAFDQSRRSLLPRPIRIALLLKLAVSVRMGYTYMYGPGVRTQTPQYLSHGDAPCDSCLADLASYVLTTYIILIGSRDQSIINKNVLSTYLE